MTRKPRTAPLRSRAPRAALGGGLVAAALLASGCQSHVGTAANVGDTRISTKALDHAVSVQSSTATGKQAGANLTRQVLTQLVLEQQVQALAAKRGVTVSQGDATRIAETYKASAGANNDEPDSYWQAQGRETATAIATMADYSAKTGNYDAVNLYAVPVKDEATGEKVLGLLSKNPAAKAAIARQYSSDPQLATLGGEAGINRLSDLKIPALSKMKKGDATIASVGGGVAVLVVEDRLDEADFARDLNSLVKVKVNPRFGTWDKASTGGFAVIPATGPLSKADPSKVADTPEPTASSAPVPGAPASAPASAPSS